MAGTGFCQVCGARIEGKRSHAQYCGPECSRRAYAERWLPHLREALRFLGREVRRLENQVSGERRRRGRGQPGG